MNKKTNRTSKLIDVRKYYDDALNQIRSSEDAWKAFLICEGRFIHYPFDIQLMIYSQRPGATACATYSQWNAINCVPRRGSKGIPYIDEFKGNPQIQYLFDIADVVSRESKPLPKLWEFPKDERYISELTEDTTENSIEVKMWNHIKGFIDSKETEELLREFNNNSEILSVEIEKLQNFFHASVSYAVFARCGLDLGVCDKLNEPLLRDNNYCIQNLDRNGLYVINDGIMRFSKPIYQKIREQIKLFEQSQTENTTKLEFDSSQEVQSPGNFKIDNLHLNDEGGPKVKFRQNIEAIKVLKIIEADQRYATPEEQAILAGFVGWGGLADVFDESKSVWESENQELHELLTESEYLAARASTLNAHYTSPAIIQTIYQALENMGVERGNILEPACGSGNFFGMLPDSMSGCQLYGVELDDLTGRIAKKLYPDVNISITGYEKTKYPNSFFDVIVGNVPFGDYKVSDHVYDKYNFSIHDYFIAKGLDQLRPGGVMAVITSSWTMEKKNSSARKYFAERANLIAAIRLPDNAFKANAGTEAVTDILFFQKLQQIPDPNPAWLHIGQNITDKDHIKDRGELVYSCNRYFIENPHMVLGTLQYVSGPFGNRLTCKANGSDLNEQLKNVVDKYIQCEFTNTYENSGEVSEKTNIISADPQVRNYTYTLVGDDIYYRTDSIMTLEDVSSKNLPQMKAMIELRDRGYELLDAELHNGSDYDISAKMSNLNGIYDAFVENFGVIHSKENKKLFSKDVTYSFLCSFEKLDDKNNVSGKAALFSKRVVNPKVEITHVDTATEALMMSLSEKGHIVLDYMAGLVGKEKDELVSDLRGIIFKDPYKTGEDEYSGYVTADEYLSGNVKRKLEKAIQSAEQNPEYNINVQYLQQVQPEPLEASEIDVRLGATWIEPEYIEQFLKELLQLPEWRFTNAANKSERLTVSFEQLNGEWNISNKFVGDSIILATTKYGTSRKNAFHILENCLNLRDSKVYDQKWNPEKQCYDSVLNKEETAICNQKAEAIKNEFENWIFAEPDRRNYLVHKYNDLYNSSRPRQYDGSHLTFPGMNPEIKLMPHQKNAVARTLYGDNTLLAHVVGAGKTYEMTASIMEQKRIGLCNKAMIVVPNHLTEQWGREFTDLYPSANLLVAKKDDFTPDRRREFCSKIATGEYDAVIIGHSQFERIPLSVERQRHSINLQIADIERGIGDQKAEFGQSFTVKQMEKIKKRLQDKLEKLNNEGKKDNVITFEQLGIDRLYVDESHNYKNLYLYTKMSDVAGIQKTEAQKSTDMYMKCQYMNEITPGKCGIVFASGTPISNSMTELYTNMRYLQSDLLKRYGLENFDAWASTFGNIQTAIELSPDGTNYRSKKRFSSFFNIPELMNLWKEAADVQTADMLNLDVPTATYVNVKLKPTKLQEKMVESLAERADAVRNGDIDPSEDNMLKITNDGRKLALDQRLINPNMPDVPVSKANVCAQKAYEIWEQTKAQRSAQIIFCDLSTPKSDGSFSVYDAIKKKLVELGVPEKEIAFIHDAKTDVQKDKLFKQVRSGEKRFLLGSTSMMGAGTNVQRNLIAEHHLDVPWRPSDIEQREGRIIRQGNENEHVWIFRYITSGTFDAYSWQVLENKQKFISQIMTSKSPVRSCDDLDEQSLSYAEVKALATGNPYIKEKMELDISVSQLNRELANHKSNIYRYQDDYTIKYPKEISRLKNLISGMTKDIELYKSNVPSDDQFSMVIGDKTFTDRTEAGEALITVTNEACILPNKEHQIGTYLGFKLSARKDGFAMVPQVIIGGEINYTFNLSMSAVSNISSITRIFHSLEERVESHEEKLSAVQAQLEIAKTESQKPFPKEELYKSQVERLNELNALLGISEKGQNETGVIDDSLIIPVEAKEESSWMMFEAYDPDNHPEEYDIVPELDTVEFIVVGGEAMEYDSRPSLGEDNEHLEESVSNEYDLVFGSVGNGITVWNQNDSIYCRPEDEVHMVADYRTLAYISPDGATVTWYVNNLPENIISSIETAAEEQRYKYNPDSVFIRGLDIERDLSDLKNAELSEFINSKGKEKTYIVELVDCYKNGQIDSGDKFISSSSESADPLGAFGKIDSDDYNSYVCVVENGDRHIYAISHEQLEFEARKYLLNLQELPEGNMNAESVVRIDFSESERFIDDEYMSFFDANNRLAGYNKAAIELDVLGYEKTYFTIYTLKEGKIYTYSGRYDIGSDSDSLIQHILDYTQYQNSDEYKATVKAHYSSEEYENEKLNRDIDWNLNEWIPDLQMSMLNHPNREIEVDKYRVEYRNAYMKRFLEPISLEDDRFTFYQDGKLVHKDEPFKQAALALLTAKAREDGRTYLLTMKILDQEVPILRGSNIELEMPVPEIDKMVDISGNEDTKKVLEHVIATVKPNIIDPYNYLGLPFNEYAAHEQDNIWRIPATVYQANDIFVSVYEENTLNALNREFKCYLKPQDILAIYEQKRLGNKPISLTKEVKTLIENVKSLVETYIAEKPELPNLEPTLQLE